MNEENLNDSLKKILIIEDDIILLNLLKDRLTYAGFNIITERDGVRGLKTAFKENPDLILLDIVLPEMDGISVLKQLKQDGNLKNIPVIIISNSGEPVEIEEIKKIGVEDYLIKTEFEPSEVLLKIETLFKKIDKNFKSAGKIEDVCKTEENICKVADKKNFSEKNQKTTVLIIEDDKFLRELLAQKLNKEGLDIVLAITAEDALENMKKTTPHLILLDLILPGISGFDFLEKIKSDSKTSGIPVIVLSNLGEDKDKETAMKLGVKDFLVKALYTPNEIVDNIKKILEKSYI